MRAQGLKILTEHPQEARMRVKLNNLFHKLLFRFTSFNTKSCTYAWACRPLDVVKGIYHCRGLCTLGGADARVEGVRGRYKGLNEPPTINYGPSHQ